MISKQKNQWIFILILLGIGLVVYYFYFSSGPVTEQTKVPKPHTSKAHAPSPELTINGRKVVNLPAGKTQKDLQDFVPLNEPSPEWQKNVKAAMLTQAGGKLKDLQIKKVESLVWIQNQTPLNVESVQISFKDPNNREIAFRALVDSQSGRLLQTWDQPVIDSPQRDSDDGIGLDPRYQED